MGCAEARYRLIPPPPAGAGTASSLTIPTKIEDRAIRANVSPNSLPPPVDVFRQSVQPNLFKNIPPRWIRPLSSLAVLLRSNLPSHTAIELPRHLIAESVNTQVSLPNNNTACTTALKNIPQTLGAMFSPRKSRCIIFHTLRALDRLSRIACVSVSSIAMSRPRYLNTSTRSRSSPYAVKPTSRALWFAMAALVCTIREEAASSVVSEDASEVGSQSSIEDSA